MWEANLKNKKLNSMEYKKNLVCNRKRWWHDWIRLVQRDPGHGLEKKVVRVLKSYEPRGSGMITWKTSTYRPIPLPYYCSKLKLSLEKRQNIESCPFSIKKLFLTGAFLHHWLLFH
jgi:hypothetical protein